MESILKKYEGWRGEGGMEGGGREGWKGEGGEGWKGGGPVKLTHLGLLSPVSVHGCWPSVMGACLHSWAFVFIRGHSSLWVLACIHEWSHSFMGGGVIGVVWWWAIGGWWWWVLMAIYIAVLLACHVVVLLCCRRACFVAPASGVRQAW